ncbi:MAG: PorT family protein [Bacteroidales bacterium]|jgi:outer membrane autotransporter protein|nr:PorT family protein [Bacteroidales bacterium]
MKVKNKFWLTVCFLTLFSFAKAQNHVHFMLFGGFNTSRLITDFDNAKIIAEEAKQFYNFGVGFRFEFAKILYLQPEFYLARKGGLEKAFRPDYSDSINQRADAQSVDLQVMLGFRFFDCDRFALRVYAGPVVSFLNNPRVDVQKNGFYLPVSTNTHIFSTRVGAGMDITKRLTFDVSYEYAISPMFSVLDFNTSYRILNFSLGLKIF